MSFKLIPVAHAACSSGDGAIDLGDCLQLGGGTTVSSVYNTPSDFVNVLIANMFVISGVILFTMILLAAWNFIAKGKEGVEAAKKIMTTALIGFVIMFSAYWLIQIVSLVTGIHVPGVPVPS